MATPFFCPRHVVACDALPSGHPLFSSSVLPLIMCPASPETYKLAAPFNPHSESPEFFLEETAGPTCSTLPSKSLLETDRPLGRGTFPRPCHPTFFLKPRRLLGSTPAQYLIYFCIRPLYGPSSLSGRPFPLSRISL